MPASRPSVPPMTPPGRRAGGAASGALVFFSWAKSRVEPLSGKSTEISLLLKPAEIRRATMSSPLGWKRATYSLEHGVWPWESSRGWCTNSGREGRLSERAAVGARSGRVSAAISRKRMMRGGYARAHREDRGARCRFGAGPGFMRPEHRLRGHGGRSGARGEIDSFGVQWSYQQHAARA